MFGLIPAAILHPEDTLRVMTYNVWVGGDRVQPLSQTAQVIRTAKADVVGFQEANQNIAKIAEELNWNVSEKAAIATHFEILEEWGFDGARHGGVKVRVSDHVVAIIHNIHLTAYPYGPYEARDKKAKTIEEIEKVERDSKRVGEVESLLKMADARADKDLPTFLTGDFNAPSHLDWVEATKTRTFGFVMPWPVSKAVERAGFKDGFRVMHRDPVKKPAYTWSPGYPVGKLEADDVMDRIDFVYFRGKGVRPFGAFVVGEKGPMTDIPVDPWPSDHRAVAVDFLIDHQ